MKLVDADGRLAGHIRVGAEIASGAEGTVHKATVRRIENGDPGRERAVAAKVYVSPDRQRAEKLRHMLRAGNPAPGAFAWPELLLSDNGNVVGFVMKLAPATAVSLLSVSAPTLRLVRAPEWTYRHSVVAAINCVELTRITHGHTGDFLVGDWNTLNTFVDPLSGSIFRLDTDSFAAAGRTFPCLVHDAELSPHEVQSPGDISQASDLHAAAVTVSRLLLQDFNPYQAIVEGLGPNDDPPTFAERSAAGACVVLKRSNERIGRVTLKPGPLGFNWPLHQDLRTALIESLNPDPTARLRLGTGGLAGQLWATLEAIEQCAADAGHFYDARVGGCPWCGTGAAFYRERPAPRRRKGPSEEPRAVADAVAAARATPVSGSRPGRAGSPAFTNVAAAARATDPTMPRTPPRRPAPASTPGSPPPSSPWQKVTERLRRIFSMQDIDW